MSRQQVLAALAAPLRVILEAELAQGNVINEEAD